MFVGDRLAAQQVKDSLIWSGEFVHKRRGGLFKRKHKPVKELRDAWGIPAVNA